MNEIHINVELQSSGGLGKKMIDCDGFCHYLRFLVNELYKLTMGALNLLARLSDVM